MKNSKEISLRTFAEKTNTPYEVLVWFLEQEKEKFTIKLAKPRNFSFEGCQPAK